MSVKMAQWGDSVINLEYPSPSRKPEGPRPQSLLKRQCQGRKEENWDPGGKIEFLSTNYLLLWLTLFFPSANFPPLETADTNEYLAGLLRKPEQKNGKLPAKSKHCGKGFLFSSYIVCLSFFICKMGAFLSLPPGCFEMDENQMR